MRSVAVLGAGTMGAQIAAHLANAGVPALLLDVTSAAAADGLRRARALKPDPFFTAEAASLVTTGGLDTDLARLADADWIIEAIVERLNVKRGLLEKVDAIRRAGSIVSSNTSGIPIGALAEGRSEDFRRHWLGTHFFNPPRYLPLLEVIPGPDTLPDVVRRISTFADRRLGKGVVLAKDSPNFIGNHIGLYGMLQILEKVAAGDYTIEEVDAITGPPLGRPKSATFRTLDLAGIDIVGHVVANLGNGAALPAFVTKMLERGLTGEKAGQGFYKRVKTPDGDTEILTLDPVTLDYRPRQSPRLGALDAAASITDTRERVRTLVHGKDRVGQFLRDTLVPTLEYTARVTPAIAHSSEDVDRVMRWGFGWELGPFELMEAIGLDTGRGAAYRLPPAAPGFELLRSAKERTAVLKRNAGASLIDLGNGVLCVEFHSKMNALGADAIEMLQSGVREASRNFAALVVGNEAPHFSAGANLMLVLLEAQDENWDELELMIRGFQQATMALKYSDVPVVVATGGLALGGGCEIALHGDRVQAAAETYMGLVEVGVGLIPAGGGTKEMVVRAAAQLAPGATDLLPVVQRAFETIAFGKTSTSAADAQRIGYLRPVDGVTMNRERLIADAKARALLRVDEGYHAPASKPVPVGGDAVRAALALGVHLAWRGARISDHDALIGRKLAAIVAGGALPHPTQVTEQHLLDLEREAFMSLVGERKTQARIQHTLKTGKPLRN
ncbi:MAG: 3-hydroxyacyl-CoA dehydrogenase/enoyl-CoA hydratase family protein [Acidobacteria bacterium]|nr:3-hydroxyacyl-CoA dehydrogenase/enoyl-CoA hydratase family protein [Acidobacteriota bacterium]